VSMPDEPARAETFGGWPTRKRPLTLGWRTRCCGCAAGGCKRCRHNSRDLFPRAQSHAHASSLFIPAG
jgi:hypothetical protein